MENTETAVDWLFNEMQRMQYFIGNDLLQAYKEAKAKEKQQIIEAVYDSMGVNFDPNVGRVELYYNEKNMEMEKFNNNIVYNAIQTPDGTILQSKHRHDYISYTDKNGQYYSVDGGLDYFKRGYDKPDFIDLSKTFSECTLDDCTKYLTWGQNYDKDMNKLPKTIFKPICELTTDHIEAILSGNYCRNEMYLQVFNYELNKRTNENT